MTHVAQNIPSNASEFLLLDIYPKSVTGDMCKDLKTNQVYYRPYVKVAKNNGLVKEIIVSLYNGIQ